jgi:hypothetical protein
MAGSGPDREAKAGDRWALGPAPGWEACGRSVRRTDVPRYREAAARQDRQAAAGSRQKAPAWQDPRAAAGSGPEAPARQERPVTDSLGQLRSAVPPGSPRPPGNRPPQPPTRRPLGASRHGSGPRLRPSDQPPPRQRPALDGPSALRGGRPVYWPRSAAGLTSSIKVDLAQGPRSPSGLGPVHSMRRTVWPPGSTTAAMLPGRYSACTRPRSARIDRRYAEAAR